MPSIQLYIGKLFLDAVVTAFQVTDISNAFRPLFFVFSLQFAVLLCSNLISHASGYVNFAISKKLSLKINQEFIKRNIHLDFATFDSPEFQNILSRAQQESSGRPLSIFNNFISIVSSSVTFFSMAAIMLMFGWGLFFIAVVVCLPLLLMQIKLGRLSYELLHKRTEDERKSYYYSGLLNSTYNRPEIHSYGLADFLYFRWLNAARRFFFQDFYLQKKRTLSQIVANFLMILCSTGATVYVVYIGLTNHNVTIGDVMLFSGSFSSGVNSVKGIASSIGASYRDSLFVENLRIFFKITNKDKCKQNNKQYLPLATIDEIKFEHVGFTYPGAEYPALTDINLVFRKKQSTLLFGANGAGKTTIIKLLMCLYEPQQGTIYINNFEISKYDPIDVRAKIGIMFQNFHPFAFSAGENIGCGCVEDMDNEKRVALAAKQALANKFIQKLPLGYKTPLTRTFTNGQDLSGGQWQRICLARLFMKKPKVYVFDEPTANLDIHTEMHFYDEFRRMAKEQICILISHRFAGPKLADNIIVLDSGTVTESGNHHELLNQNAKYAEAWKMYNDHLTG